MSHPRFQMLSRPGCHLCEEMAAVLRAVLPDYEESFEITAVDSRPEWQQRFGEVIPVLLRDGKPVAKIRLDRQRLERIIERSRVRSPDR